MEDDERICNYCGEGIADDARLYRLYGFDYHESCCDRYIREVYGRSDVGFRTRPGPGILWADRFWSAVLQMRDDLDRGTCTCANVVDKAAGVLSEAADRLLTALRLQVEVWLCPECAEKRLPLANWDVMQLIRALLAEGVAVCRYMRCESCLDEKMVVTTRSRLTRLAG